jgi:lysylphosphatidylglycerol synthetase-like protein (DUF2156 family)
VWLVIRILQYLVIANGLLLVLQSVRVIAVYSAVYSLTKNKDKRLLPLHVWLMAISYLIFVGTTSFYLLTAPTQNATGRTVLYGVAGLLGQYALLNVLRYDRRKISAATNFQDPDDELGR